MGLGILEGAGGRRLRRCAACMTMLCLLAGVMLPVEPVRAKESDGEEYPLLYGTWDGPEDDVLELQEAGDTYRVLPGDSLWNISEKLWGDGRWYGELVRANQEVSGHPDLIYPGTELQTGRSCHIVRKEAKYGGMQMGSCSFDTPGGWTVGTISSGAASANLVLSGDGAETIACLVQDKKEDTVLTVQDWESCMEKIRDHADRNYPGTVSRLSFEHYRMNGEEEVYLYSFLWKLTAPETEQELHIPLCMGMKLTKHMQAEFLGFAGSYDIHGGIRYVTASFREDEDYDPQRSSVNDSNMAILPQTQWEMEGMYDPFAWAEAFFTALTDKASGAQPEPESLQEGMIGQISRPGERR